MQKPTSHESTVARPEDIYADRSPKQMDAVHKTEEVANAVLILKAQELLQNLITPDGQKVSLQELLLGPAKKFGEILALQIDDYYTKFFNNTEMQSTFSLFVREIFRQIIKETNYLRDNLKQNEQDPSRGALPTIDEYTAQIFVSSFLRAKRQRVA